MAAFRQGLQKCTQPSRRRRDSIHLRVKIGDCEFAAEGAEKSVTRQFEQFLKLVNSRKPRSSQKLHRSSARNRDKQRDAFLNDDLSLPYLKRIFDIDPRSANLFCHTPPSGKEPEANLALLLLLGYRILRGLEEVSVVALKQALKRSSHPVLRVDRVLNHYRKERFIVKLGRGKGGRYRLTPLGIQKAQALATELVASLPA